ncbi:transglycosylase domain-containing protein [Trueperella bialowiezensis]|uniref:Penicillin-binding protein 1A/1B n=1 Tax=Trueperella bialowiezensis TaxID=312285 RepID=A0A448PEL0_9ACTO|nr:transglycosylase domain-containing protein [Trueperella bialowiezensis]VEI13328.1 Penicillin-binding protein 1A/1B [Trueperella bialowiezensis]
MTKNKKRGRGYPRQGMGPIRRWLPSWRVVLGTFLTLVAMGIGALVGLYVTTDIPEADEFALAQKTTVYYEDGTTELGQYSELNRSSVPLDQISPSLQHAVIASEDASFYENSGIDLRGIARAFWNNVQGKPLQGGSTLTQQYAERYYMGTTTSIPGKIKEAILAIKIDQTQSKEEILENYLNTIYFGRGAYGIEAAAQAYFGIPAANLDLSQSAMLAGIIPAPSAWDPAVDPDRANERFERVLGLMVDEEWITQAEADAASFPNVQPVTQNNSFSGTNGYLLDSVRSELLANGFTEQELATAGFQIVTTIDEEKQQAAVDAVAGLPEDRPDNNHVGLLSVDPRNGEIYAMYGGADYLERQRNSATQDRAQGGSTFKMFGVVEALDQGISPDKRYDAPAQYTVGNPGGSQIVFNNVDERSYPNVTVRDMTARSLNTSFIKLNEEIGPHNTKEMAIKLGLSEDTPGLDDGVGNVLGSASPNGVEMATAFGTLANDGERVTPHIVREVRDRDGNRIYTGDTTAKRAISAETAQLATDVLQGTLKSGGTAAEHALPDRPAAGKTGTSSGPMSAWFAAYVPQMVTVVNMYAIADDGSEAIVEPFGGVYQVAGGNFPAQVWHDYMVAATEDMDVIEFADVSKLLAERAPAPAPVPTQSPSPSESPSPTPSPTPSEPAPEPEPEPAPAPQPTPAPAPAPAPPPPADDQQPPPNEPEPEADGAG